MSNDSPSRLADRLQSLAVLESPQIPTRWEQRVGCWKAAAWACRTVANAILDLERIPTNRIRSFQNVAQQVTLSLMPLPPTTVAPVEAEEYALQKTVG